MLGIENIKLAREFIKWTVAVLVISLSLVCNSGLILMLNADKMFPNVSGFVEMYNFEACSSNAWPKNNVGIIIINTNAKVINPAEIDSLIVLLSFLCNG